MKKFKKLALAAAVLAIAALAAACGDNTPAANQDDPPAYNNGDTGIYGENSDFGDYYGEDVYDENGYDNGELHGSEIDWSQYSIIIDNAIGIAAEPHTAEGSEFPTHVPLAPVAYALGALDTLAEGLSTDPPLLSIDGLNGSITFEIGSPEFNVDGEGITLEQPALLIDGEIYVPIEFFRDVFGMGSAFWTCGHVHIDRYAGDMH